MSIIQELHNSFDRIYHKFRDEYPAGALDFDRSQSLELALFHLLKALYMWDKEEQSICSFSTIPSDYWIREHIKDLLYN